MVGRRRASNPSALAARGSRRAWVAWLRRLALGGALATATATHARSEPPESAPWSRRVTTLELDLSPSGLFNQDVTSLSFGLSSRRYVFNGLSLGLGVSDTLFIYRDAFTAQHPGIDAQLPTNMVEVVPLVQYVFLRSRWFSPYVYGGMGPVFFNHGGGTHGQWTGGPGVYIHVRGPIFASVGVAFSGLFPSGRCNDALVYQSEGANGPGMPVDLCSFRWGPQLGVTLAFGGRRHERRPPRAEPREPASAAPRQSAAANESRPPLEEPADSPVIDSSTGTNATPDTDLEPSDVAPLRAPGAPIDETPRAAPGSTDVPDPPPPGQLAPSTSAHARPSLRPRSADRPPTPSTPPSNR